MVIAGSLSGVGAAIAASGNGTKSPPVPVTPTSTTTVAQAPVQGVTQTISVSVRGGSLSVRPASVVVPLTRDGHGRAQGHADIDVIDARGTLTGWTATAAVQFAGGRLSVRPGKPAVVDGYNSGLAAGKKAEVRSGAVVTLGSAAAGGGGGTYRIPVGLELSGPQTPSAVTVTLVPQVAGS